MVRFAHSIASRIQDQPRSPSDTTTASYSMSQERYEIPAVFEAPLTDVEPVYISANKFLWIVRRIPCLEEDIAEDNVLHVRVGALR